MDDATKSWGNMREGASILGVSTSTLTRWMGEGIIEVRKLGQRISLEDVRRLAELGEEEYMRERYRKSRTK